MTPLDLASAHAFAETHVGAVVAIILVVAIGCAAIRAYWEALK